MSDEDGLSTWQINEGVAPDKNQEQNRGNSINLAPLYLALLNKEDSIQSFYGLKSIYYGIISQPELRHGFLGLVVRRCRHLASPARFDYCSMFSTKWPRSARTLLYFCTQDRISDRKWAVITSTVVFRASTWYHALSSSYIVQPYMRSNPLFYRDLLGSRWQ